MSGNTESESAKSLMEKAGDATSSTDALQYSQAALNVANAEMATRQTESIVSQLQQEKSAKSSKNGS